MDFPIIFVEPQGDHAISKEATAIDVIANPIWTSWYCNETVVTTSFLRQRN